MKLTVTMLSNNDIFVLDVNGDIELENFKALCEFETGIPTAEISLLWNGRPLHEPKRKLEEYGLKEGEILLLQRMQGGGGNIMQPNPMAMDTSGGAAGGMPMIDFSNITVPGSSRQQSAQPSPPSNNDPAVIRQSLLSDPHQLSLLKERNRPLADALLSGSLEKFKEVYEQQKQELMERRRHRMQLLAADPFDPEVQNKIAEEIRLENVESNMETAMEYNPESFGQVCMLYINVTVNGHPLKAFVDSGAQMTIMSRACAERCSIMRLIDNRWSGVAKGVGEQRIIGRVHLCQIQIGPDFHQTSFSILENQRMDMLLGLDMLKRHQCTIDLKNNKLIIGTTGTETSFLSENDLPEHARLQEPEGMDEDTALAKAMNQSVDEAANASTSGTTSATTTQSEEFKEDDIKKLTAYGFSREQVLAELRLAQGDIDQALAALLAKSISVPT